MDEISERESEILFLVASMSLSALLAICIVLFFGLRQFTKPIKTLSLGASIIGRGDLSHRVRIDSRDEIGGLAQSFNQMADDLLQSYTALRESEEKFRFLAEKMADIVWTLDLDMRTTYVSPSIEKVLGFTPEERKRQSLEEMITPECLQKVQLTLVGELGRDQGISSDPDRSVTMEVEYYRKDGSTVWMENNVRAIRDHSGTIVEIYGVSRDITERKQAEEELRRRAEEFSALYETSLQITATHDLPTLFHDIVQRATLLLNGDGGGMYLSDRDKQQVRCMVSHNTPRDYAGTVLRYGEGAAGLVAATGEPLIVDEYAAWEGRAQAYEREKPFGSVISAPMKWQGEVVGVIHVLRDLGKRKFTQRDMRLLILFANQAAVAMQNARLVEDMKRWADELARRVLEVEERTAELKASNEMLAREIDQRKQVEEALRESEGKYKLLAEHSADIIYKLDIKSEKFVYVSPSAAGILGYSSENTTSLRAQDVLTAESYAKQEEGMQEALASGRTSPATIQLEAIHKHGHTVPIEISAKFLFDERGNPKEIVGTARDISERKRAEEEKRKLEEQLWQARKAESLGRMAGAVAHHYNNLMGVVMGNIEMALLGAHDGPGVEENLAQAMKACRRAADISHLMLAYLGQSTGKREPMDLSGVCRKALALLTAAVPEELRVRIEFPASGPFIRGNAVQVKQVLSNLVTNAVEAIGEGKGEIAISISAIRATDIPLPPISPADWEPKGESYACLSVADTGCGMDRGIVENIFDPFFSTKFTGRGLGLPVVGGIVKAHEGAVTVESRPGQGATFRVFLPVVTDKPFQSREAESVEPGAAEGKGLVLVVEDEPMLRNLAKTMLKQIGYEVIMAADGAEAVEVFRKRQHEIRCVLCDLTMPRMDGWETLEALRRLRSDIPVILASGYDQAQVMAGEHREYPQVFLHKPYTSADLKSALAAMLKAPNETA